MTTIKDHTGKRRGRLVFVRPTTERKHRAVVWEMLCDCGNICYKTSSDIVGKDRIGSCGCLSKERLVYVSAGKQRKHEPRISSARYVWDRSYHRECSFELFLSLSQQLCHYCGAPPTRTFNLGMASRKYGKPTSELAIVGGDFTYNGLDRMDSTRGHTEDNMVPCCWPCNKMKSTTPYNEFKKRVREQYLHWASK